MYQFLIRVLSPVILILIAIDAIKRNGGWRFFKQRLGMGYASANNNHYIWIHCASVGEVNAAAPLIEHLLSNKPDQAILITTNTPTGEQHLKQCFQTAVEHAYCPMDYPYAIKRFLANYDIKQLWVMETEIWPNLYRLVAQQNIAIRLLNARLSQKTLKAPNWLKNQYRQSLEQVSQIISRSAEESNRFQALGAKAHKVITLGNLKYAKLTLSNATTSPISQPYIVLASSHDPEEMEITSIWQQLKRPELLVIVPRHAQRAKQIAKQLNTKQINTVFFSDIHQDHSFVENLDTQSAVLIVDQMGRLMSLFSQAKLVIMGGSFVSKGGHNILEPASCARAIITGPDMSDFEDETARLIEQQGLIQCQNYSELKQQLIALLDDENQLKTLGKNAENFIASQQTVLNEYLKYLNID